MDHMGYPMDHMGHPMDHMGRPLSMQAMPFPPPPVEMDERTSAYLAEQRTTRHEKRYTYDRFGNATEVSADAKEWMVTVSQMQFDVRRLLRQGKREEAAGLEAKMVQRMQQDEDTTGLEAWRVEKEALMGAGEEASKTEKASKQEEEEDDGWATEEEDEECAWVAASSPTGRQGSDLMASKRARQGGQARARML